MPPTNYLAPPTPSQPPAAPGAAPDATLEFADKLADPQRWVIKTGVPIFKSHQRTDPATGKLIKVDLPKLHRIAENIRRLEEQGGVPLRLTLGHTEPEKPEPEQPPVAGYYRNARVAPFGPKGEPAIVVDEWLDPQYQGVRKNYPYRSSEYYDDAEQITGVALLTRDPFLDLGVVAYERGDNLVCYTANSTKPDRRLDYARAQGQKPVLYHLVLGERETVPTPYGNWGGAIRGAVEGGTTGAKLGSKGGTYGTAAGAIGGAALGGYTGWKSEPNEGRQVNDTQYQGCWPGPQHQRANIGHQHESAWRFSGDNMPARYGEGGSASSTLGGAAGGATLGGMVGGPVGALAGGALGGAAGAVMGARYNGQGRGAQRQYAEGGPSDGPPGAGGGGGPAEKLQMIAALLMEVSQEIGGGAPQGPPPGPPQSPMPEGGEEYARYQAARYAQARRQSGYGRNPRRYATEAVPTPYGAEVPQAPMTTISGRPVGESIEIAKLKAQLSQYANVTRMLAYERDQADTTACQEAIQRLADQGYSVTEREVESLKKLPHAERPAFLEHICTHYSKIGTEQMPTLLGDPTPAGPDPNLNRPASKDEMEKALKMVSANPQLNYSAALEQVRYGATQPAPFGGVNRIAAVPGVATGPADANPQYAEWAPQATAGFNPAAPYG